jgi:tetratricopeptide (TPR) repeat protein
MQPLFGSASEGVPLQSVADVRHRARGLIQKGLALLKTTNVLGAHFVKYEEAVRYFQRAALMYLSVQRPREAVDAFLEVARVFIKFLKEPLNAAMVFVHASEIAATVDKSEAIACLKEATTILCDLGDFSLAGNLQYEVATMQSELRQFEDAAASYQRAGDFITESPDRSYYCLTMAAESYCEVKMFREARDLFYIAAQKSMASNMLRFNCKTHLFNAIMCDLGIRFEGYKAKVALSEILTKMNQYVTIDFSWLESKEYRFLFNLIRSNLYFNRDEFADHIYWWNCVKPFTRWQIAILHLIASEVEVKRNDRLRRADRARRREEQTKRREDRSRLRRIALGEEIAKTMKDDSDSDDVSSDTTHSEDMKSENEESVEDGPPVDLSVLNAILPPDDFEQKLMEEQLILPDNLKDSFRPMGHMEKKWVIPKGSYKKR